MEDVEFLEKEISCWFRSILQKDWKKIARQSGMDGLKIERLLHERFTGLAISENQITYAIRKAGMDDSVIKWTDDDLLRLCTEIRRAGKPMIIAANKCDKAPAENMDALGSLDDTIVIPTSAEYELALRKAAKAGLVDYEYGAGGFEIIDDSKLTGAQVKGLDQISGFLEKWGSTGVQKCLETAIFDLLELIPVYPVEDENKLTDKEGRVLPDVHLLPKGSTAKDLAYKVHTDIGDNFIRAIDARSKRVVGADHELRKDDVITIVARR